MRKRLLLILALVLLAVACNRNDETTTTSSTEAPTTTTSTATTTDTSDSADTTTTTGGIPDYVIVAGDSEGTLVVLIEPGTYTEIDLQNLMEDVVDLYSPEGAHLIDSEDAQELVLREELTAEEEEILEGHYLARLTGTMLEFLGPYAEFGSIVIGS